MRSMGGMVERCYMCGNEAYVLMDRHWMCREHYNIEVDTSPDASG